MKTTGTEIGLKREATIIQYNQNGTMDVALNEAGFQESKKKFTVDVKLDWIGSNGQIAGGFPIVGSTVSVVQGQGGKWYVDSYLSPNGAFQSANSAFSLSANTNLFSNFKPQRYLIQTSNENSFYLDPKSGIFAGGKESFFQLDSSRDIFSVHTKQQYEFSESHTKVAGIIKRDKGSNSNRNLTSSSISGLQYDDNLTSIGLDPATKTNNLNSFNLIRNIPLTEERKTYYEFAPSFEYQNDFLEIQSYDTGTLKFEKVNNDRRKNRTISLNLHDQNLNSLLEIICGTLVDSHGNILDLNYSLLPLGRRDDLNLSSNQNKSETFIRLRQELSQSVAYHFELNNRHYTDQLASLHNPLVASRYGKEKSRFSFDINKQGQFKLNIPNSANFGLPPLLARPEHYNLILTQKKPEFSAHELLRNVERQDIYLSSSSSTLTIPILNSEETNVGPINYLTDDFIFYGTMYHNIIRTCSESQTKADYLSAERKLVNFSKNNHLNRDFAPLPKIVSESLYSSGSKSNIGGRSGLINLDGFLNLNIGKNESDGQSLWFDYQGGVVGNIGRDNQNVSYAVSMDGDCFFQIGGQGIENQTYRNGTLDIKVWNNGQMMIFRMGPQGITIVSPGQIVFDSQQDIIFRTNGALKMQAEIINFYSDSLQSRNVNRIGGTI